MSLRSPVRSLLVAGLASWIVLGTALTDGHAQTPPPIPPIPGGLPGIPGIPGAPSAPFPIPTSLPAPGATPGIPSIPGIPGLKLFSPTGSLLMPVMKEETKKIYQREKF